jgi:hypothetical protein
MTSDADDDLSPCASPPCFMDEVDPAYMGLPSKEDPQRCRDDESAADETKPRDLGESSDSAAERHSPLAAPPTGSETSGA